MNKRKLFNSKWEKVVVSLLSALVVILMTIFVCNKIAEQKAIDDILGKVNIDSGDVGYQGNLNEISTEDPIKKLSEKEFILDKEAKTISVDESLVGGSFCISSSPDGPTENDSWKYVDNGTISLNENEQAIMQNQEEQKVYVYYMAGNACDMSNYNSSATIYIIASEADLKAFRTKVNGGVNFSGKTVYLAKNITITETSFTPIGTSTAPFSGTFDGNGYTISGLNISSTSNYVGLFGYANATIKNVVVDGTKITGGSYVGAIAGYNTGTIANCTNNVAVTGAYAVGGIVGQSNGDVKFCKNTVAITSSVTEAEKENYLGGIIGISDVKVTIYNCENRGAITGYGSYIGGIVGGITSNGVGSTVQYCTNYGSCSSSASGGNYIGGIVGFAVGESTSNYTKILNCRNEGTITLSGGNHAGGIIGGKGYLYIEYCVNTGAINNQYTASGGILARGETYCYVSRCYNRGDVTCTERGRAGGIVGFLSKGGHIHGCANTAAIKGCTQSSGNEGKHQGVAGILGYSTDGATVQYSINIGNITGYRYTAGIVGCFSTYGSYKPTLKHVISYGKIKNTSGHAAGIATFTYYNSMGTNMSLTKCYFGGSCQNNDDSTKRLFIYKNGEYYSNSSDYSVDKVSSVNGFDCTTIYDLVGDKKANNWAIAPTLIQNPFDVVRPVGTTATLSTIWIGANTEFTYQWYVATSETGAGTAVSGGTLTTFTGGATVKLDATVTNTNKWYYLVLSGIDYTGAATSVTTERALVGPGEDVLLDPGLSISPTSLSITYGTTGTVTASRNGSGAITATSANTGIATVGVSGTTISVKGNSVGNTTITVNLAANGAYTSATKTFNVTVNRAKIAVPTGTDRTYNGTSQTGLSAGTGYTVGGTTSAKDAGSYTATVTPTSNYQWSDGTTTAKNVGWKINAKSVAVSWGAATSFTYNGSAQAPTATASSGVNGETLNISRTTGTNVGNYTSTASISSVSGGSAKSSNYALTGATKEFTITKAAGSVVLSSSSGTYTYPTSGTFTVTTNKSGGTLSVKSSNTNIAAASISGTTVTVTPGTTAGTATITVTSAATTNYNSASATYTATVKNGTLNVTANNYSGTYDGKAHGISVSCSTSGATITYCSTQSGTYSATNPTYTTAGTYTTYYKVTKAGYTTETGSKTVTIAKATSSVSVKITGETTVGKTLTATPTTASNGTKSYQWWYSSTANATSGTAISGATSSTYVVTSSVVGYYISVTVSVAEGTNYKAGTGTAITTSKVAGTNYKDNAGNYYETLKEAFDNAASGSTITVLKDNTDSSIAKVASGKTFILATNGKTITKTTSGITNSGTLTIQGSGTIQTAEYANNSLINLISNTGTLTVKEATLENKGISTTYWYVINSSSGTVNVESGKLKASGTESKYNARGMYIGSGTINIKGGTIESEFICIHSYDDATGTINITNGTLTANSYSALNISGTNNKTNLNITGGTLKSQGYFGITANTTGTVKIGADDKKVSITSPVIQGENYAINTSNSFYFYDGILKGKASAYNGTVTAIPNGYEIYHDTEIIDGATYKTAYLVPYLMERECNYIMYSSDDTVPDLQPYQYQVGTENIYVYTMYAIGASKANKTQYTSDKIKNITILDNVNIPNGADNWDVSMAQDSSIMAWVVANGEMYDLYIGSNGKMFTPANSFNLFAQYINCETITGLKFIDTRYTTNMMRMFGVNKVATLDLNGFNVENVEDLSYMFRSCENLTELNLNSFKTNSLKNMECMFTECSKLEKIEWKNINTTNVTDMYGLFNGCIKIQEIDLSNFNTEKVTTMQNMFRLCGTLSKISIDKFNTSNVTNMNGMFWNCSLLAELDVSNFDTSNVTDMGYMFVSCLKLTNIDLSNFDTRKVTNIDKMFKSDSALKIMRLGNDFNKINGTEMFTGCTSLTAIITTRTSPMTLSTDIGVESLTKLYVPSVEAETAFESATNYEEVFGKDRVQPILELIGNSVVKMVTGDTYTELGATVAGMTKNSDGTYTPYGYTVTITDLPEITGAGVYKIIYTIYEKGDTKPGMSIERIISVAAGDYLMSRESGTATYILGAKRQNEETGEALYLNYTSDKVKTITIINTENTSTPTNTVASWDVSQIYGDNQVTAWIFKNDSMLDLVIGSDKPIVATSGTNLFANYSNCTSITGLEYLNTELLTSMQNMFSGCLNLPSLEVEKMSTNSASTMEGMFKNCNTLTSLNLGNMLTIMCTNMKDMFSGCSNIQSLNVTKFYTANVKNMSGMFEGCSNLTNLNVKYFDTTNVENFASMFNGCNKLTEIDVKDFMTSKAKSVGAMFKDCSSLETLDLSNFNLSALDGETYSNSIDSVKNINQNFMFDGCTKLEAIVLGKKFARINGTNMFRNCNALECIIAQSETPMTLGTNTGISNTKIYVPKQANVASYKVATNYTSVFGSEGIGALLEINGENKVQVPLGSSYTDKGATVAGYSESEKAKYERFGYTLTTTGLPIDTNTIGKYHVIYKLYYFDQTIDTASN